MSKRKSIGFGVGVTTLALALVLPTSTFASPPESETPIAPVEITPAPLPAEPTPVAPSTQTVPPPPVLVHDTPAPMPLDDRAVLKKKTAPGRAMVIAGFTVLGIWYVLGGIAFTWDAGEDYAAMSEAFAVPVVGPFIAAGRADTPASGFVTSVPGLIQVAGLAIGLTGVALIQKAKREHRAGRISIGGGGLRIRF